MTGLFTPGRTATMSEAAGEAAVLLDRVIEAMGGARREGQRIMVEEIAAAIEGGAHLLVQAGTGTGKSIGYLVPLLDHCRRSGERALVSTATLALQRQIITKDAPVVIEAMAGLADWRPRIAVFKGWSNYLCLNRVHGGYPGEGTLFDALDTAEAKGPSALGEEVVRLREWAKTTDTGDRDDLVPGVTDRAWRQASVSKRECLGRACPMIDDCFAQAARLEAAEADLVVTNHSLFGIHCTGETDILPQFGPVVIDEAHELADRVRDQSTLALSAGMLARIARTLRSRTKIEAEDLERAAEELGAAIAPLPKGLVEERPGPLVDVMLLVDEALRRAASAVSDSRADSADKTLARAAVDEARAFIDAWSKDPDSMILSVSALQGAESDLISISPLDVAPALGLRGFGERGGDPHVGDPVPGRFLRCHGPGMRFHDVVRGVQGDRRGDPLRPRVAGDHVHRPGPARSGGARPRRGGPGSSRRARRGLRGRPPRPLLLVEGRGGGGPGPARAHGPEGLHAGR